MGCEHGTKSQQDKPRASLYRQAGPSRLCEWTCTATLRSLPLRQRSVHPLFLAASRGLRASHYHFRGPMATKLDKSIKRELEHQGKLYTITLAPEGVKVVEKGKRNGKELSWASIISGDAALNEDLKISVDASRSGM